MKKRNNNRYSQLGFTLVELMIAATIGAIIIAGAGSVMVSQKNFHKQQTRIVTANAALRKALSYMRDRVSMMGYGMPRPFITTTCSVDNYLNNSGGATACNGTQEADDAYVGDRLHVMYRNPMGEWSGYALGSTLTLSSPAAAELDATFPVGQTLLVYGGPGAYGLFIAKQAKTGTGSTGINYVAPTRFNGGASIDTIRAANSTLKIGLVESYMFRVYPHTDSNGDYVNTLVVELGRDLNGDGQVTEADYMPLADGIYDFQVKYYYDKDGDGYLSQAELDAPVAPATQFNVTLEGGTTKAQLNSAVEANSLTARAQLKAVELNVSVYKTDTPKSKPNTLTWDDGPINARYAISEFILLNNASTTKGLVTSISDVNSFTWIGSEILKVSAQ